MSRIEIYSLILCLVVLVGLVALFSYFLVNGIKQRIKLIALGDEDQEIKIEYEKANKKPSVWDTIAKIFSLVVTVMLCCIFAFAIYINLTEEKRANGIPSLKVVQSASMSYKNSNNGYLSKNGLDDQLQVYDLILTRHLPDEFDLKLYDIVVYQAENGDMVIHRIVGIEEPNEKHPEHRYFKLQGDAIAYPDTYPVTYSQMRGIYVGEKIPFAGSVVMFMQSPAGYFCIALIVISIILFPLMEKKINEAKKQRLQVLLNSSEALVEEPAKALLGTVEELAIEASRAALEAEEELAVDSSFGRFRRKKNDKTFFQRLSESTQQTKEFYKELCALLEEEAKVSKKDWAKHISYRAHGKPLAKMTIRGKTLNLYINLDPKEFKESKYVFTDLSEYKKHSSCPMHIKLTSKRKVKHSKELLRLALSRGGKA